MLLVAGVLLATCIYLYYWYKFSFFTSRGIPGPKPTFFLGNIMDNLEKPWMNEGKRREQAYGKVYGIYDFATPKLVISDPVILKNILVKDFAHFTDRITARFEHPIERKMMFVLKGEEWSAWRKIMTPAFSSHKLKAMMPLIQSSVDHMVTEIKKQGRKGGSIDIRSVCRNFSLEVIAKTGLGIEMNLQEKTEPVVEAIKRYFTISTAKIVMGYMLPRWIKSMIGYTAFNKEGLESAVAFTKVVMHERRTNLKHQQNRTYADFTSLLLAATMNGETIPDDDIVANIIVLFLAGFDAISLLTSITIFMLAQHPQVQQQLHQEVRNACMGMDGYKIDFDTVQDMKYMEAVLNEVLRLYPAATYTERKVSKEYNMNRITLPVGLNVYIPIYIIQHDENNYPQPETFHPERFLPERAGQIDSFTFLPFGLGPRSCPGIRFTMLEAKIALSRLLMQFEFVPSSDGPDRIDVSNTVDELLQVSDFFVCFKERPHGTYDG